jgi:hypothetical protein
MLVGYFDPDRMIGADLHDLPLDRPLDPGIVQRLQAACDELFGIELRLADYHHERAGILMIVDLVITKDMFRVACVAHELFGMSAVDHAHRTVVYPRPDWEAQSLEWYVRAIERADPHEGAMEILETAREWHERQVQRAEFERQVVERVRAALRGLKAQQPKESTLGGSR